MKTSKDETVAVTGASGFIASHTVQALLEHGYRVRGTVRNLAKKKDYAHLSALAGAAERLELVEADLLTPRAFDAVVKDATYVLHMASPYVLDVKDPQKDLVEPALTGTRNVLTSCLRANALERVVVTSSVAAITDQPEPGRVLTEADWNTKTGPGKPPNPSAWRW
jgi:dihydroflavonol-4-reductase